MNHSGIVRRSENLASTFACRVAMKERGVNRAKETSIQRSYELEKILLRVHRGVCCPVRVWLPLVCHADARRASRSANTLATRSRPKELLQMVGPGSVRHGVLFHRAVCSLRAGRTRRRRSDAGLSGGISIRGATFDLIRSPTINL